MVVIVLVALIVTFGHASYQNYVIRARLVSALKSLEEYQEQAINFWVKNGYLDAYYVLFTDDDTTGLVYGSPGDSDVEKAVDLNYVNRVHVAVAGSGNNWEMWIGARLQNIGDLNNSYIYLYRVFDNYSGRDVWLCGNSDSRGLSAAVISLEYLPAHCTSDSQPP